MPDFDNRAPEPDGLSAEDRMTIVAALMEELREQAQVLEKTYQKAAAVLRGEKVRT